MDHAKDARESIDTVRGYVDNGELVPGEDKFNYTPAAALGMIAAAELAAGDAKAAKTFAMASIDACEGTRDAESNVPFSGMMLAAAEVRLGNLDAGIAEATTVLDNPGFDGYTTMLHGRALLSELAEHTDEPLVAAFRDQVQGLSRKMLPARA